VTPFDGAAYQARFDALAAQGVDVHGEAALVLSLAPRSVLDAGCGTGRVAIQLAGNGLDVVGVDRDPAMLAEASRRAPGQVWVQADLAGLDLGRTFDVVLLAGNVPLFCPAESRVDLVRRCAAHVATSGVMVAGFQLDHRYRLEDWDEACQSAHMILVDRWSTWDRQTFDGSQPYAVSVHRRSRS
jgi:SAM-dependent methyltransferase